MAYEGLFESQYELARIEQPPKSAQPGGQRRLFRHYALEPLPRVQPPPQRAHPTQTAASNMMLSKRLKPARI